VGNHRAGILSHRALPRPLPGSERLPPKPGVSLAGSLNPRLTSCIPPGCQDSRTLGLSDNPHFPLPLLLIIPGWKRGEILRQPPLSARIVPIMNLADIRIDYRKGHLTREELQPNPIRQFEAWMSEAVAAKVVEPTAMSLATADAAGRLLLRTVLLKGVDDRGFVFFTNFESRKARHIAENPAVSLLFPWLALERQVIVTGTAERISTAESLTYFLSRPRDSQLGAWASRQSAIIESRKFLEMEWERIKNKFHAGEVPLPSFWGGFRVKPVSVEFWQGGSSRLHDRFEYRRSEGEAEEWSIERLSP
jgi:pyridoxamine 5'-phosphate oxidase